MLNKQKELQRELVRRSTKTKQTKIKMMQGTGLKYNCVHLCSAADLKATKHLQFV